MKYPGKELAAIFDKNRQSESSFAFIERDGDFSLIGEEGAVAAWKQQNFREL